MTRQARMLFRRCGVALALLLLVAALAPGAAWANGGGRGGGWQGGGGSGWHGGGGGGWRGGYGGGWQRAGWYRGGWYGPRVFVGGPYWGPWPYAYPYYGFPYRYYAPPLVVAPTPVVVQPPPPPVYVQPPQQYWYYCQNPAGYYPEVGQCPSGWTPVAPQPAGPTQ